MATWKENGVVPDSDDDDFDSQSITNIEKNNQASIHTFRDSSFSIQHGNGRYQIQGVGQDLVGTNWEAEQVDVQLSEPPSLQVGTSQKEPALPSEDDISKTYVEITSPTSTQLSSPPRSLPDLPPNNDTTSLDERLPSSKRLEAALGYSIVDNGQWETAQEHPNPYKRSFRRRNAIQIHPYVVEQEKYRQTLKARGIAPMRIASSQDVRQRSSRHSASPNLEYQEHDSQDVDFELGESQAIDLDWDQLPPSSPPRPENNVHSEFNNHNNPRNDDEDEFPDIDELLQNRLRLPQSISSKSKLKSYSSNSKRSGFSSTQTRPQKIMQKIGSLRGVPPQINPNRPILAPSPRGRASLSRIGSSSSNLQSPTGFSDEGSGARGSAEPPTPATSTTNPITDPILLDSESDLEAPLDTNHMQSESESSEGSVQIRKLGKRFRGVLPASHLRLGQQKQKTPMPSRAHRDSLSASPVKLVPRRGVALPRIQSIDNRAPAPTSTAFAFISDDSEEETQNGFNGFIMEDEVRPELKRLFSQSRIGFAEEDDGIDAMLPSFKRHSTGRQTLPQKKRRVGSSSLYRTGSEGYQRQPKITEHLRKPRHTVSSKSKAASRIKPNKNGIGRITKNYTGGVESPSPPWLSILDVAENDASYVGRLPQFIKIAARTARSRSGQGRQSPSRKFFRLASREDTQDVQSVLTDWKEGRIRPKSLNTQHITSWPPLQRIENNQQSRFRPPSSKVMPRSHVDRTDLTSLPRKLKFVPKGKQQSMSDFVGEEATSHQQFPPLKDSNLNSKPRKKYQQRISHAKLTGRPAQLESSEMDYSRRHPTAAFKSTKKALDALFRTRRKRPAPKANFQLSRFLADEDVVQLPGEREDNQDTTQPSDVLNHIEIHKLQKSSRLRKRSTQRIDVGAAVYRQPTDPLILEFLIPKQAQNGTDDNNKLGGLGKFGTKYPLNFDIFPLQPGVFFHEGTFIGSGRLSSFMHATIDSQQSNGSHNFLRIGENAFSWNCWDGKTSSEIGLCFDWILDQILDPDTAVPRSPTSPTQVVIYILTYAQHDISFIGLLNRTNFISRMIEIIQEFSTRLTGRKNSFGPEQMRHGIEVLSLSTLLVYKLLDMSRIDNEEMTLDFKLEELLKQVASRTISFLLSDSLDSIRKLYDDLQYLSFRECGIKNDQHAAQAWVIIMTVLQEAHIPRGSFWELVSPLLLVIDIKNISDAPTMEKIWYNLFTLLPMTSFDQFGVLVTPQGAKTSHDNWYLPQQLMKRVFSFYTLNHRQFPGFNDYCRTLLGRCHYLMVEWGWWKCSTLIGTLFDFFASQNLADLRNEEVYTSPRFLRELDTEPSLEVEPEDRSFHIFLKIVALGIKHLRKVSDTKNIRNLVARLLPNHDRQYLKEENIHQQDLASLRNHHDLLCTLYWASPPDQRPSVTLIQGLVIADRSHKEACLINLRAWENLSRFIVSNSTDTAAYEPFTAWQYLFFASLRQQYLDGEIEVRKQAESLQREGGEAMTESQISEVVLKNRRSDMTTMCTAIQGMQEAIRAAKSGSMAKQALNCEILSQSLEIVLHAEARRSDGLLEACIKVIRAYMDQIDLLHPSNSSSAQSTNLGEGDSQDSLETALNWLRIELVIPIQHDLLPSLSSFTRKRLTVQANSTRDTVMYLLIDCWARLVSTITEDGAMALGPFLTHGQNAIFEQRNAYDVASTYWSFFLGKILECKTIGDLQIPGFDIGQEWLLALTKPGTRTVYEDILNFQLHQKGFYLCEEQYDESSENKHLIRGAIRKMSTIIIDKETDLRLGLTQKQAQKVFSDILGEVMNSMQQVLESQESNSVAHKNYLELARAVITDIKCYVSDFRPLTDFFVHPSTYYWPHDADPNLYAAGIVSYCIRLAQQTEKTSFELFYYLHGGWKNALISGRMENYMNCISKGMKRWDFTRFILSEFVPAILDAGFGSGGWLLCSTFLPLISHTVALILEKNTNNSEWVFEHMINILIIIINGTKVQERQFQNLPAGLHHEHRGILSIVFNFWLSVASSMRQYVERNPDQKATLEEITNPLSSFMHHAVQTFNGESQATPLIGQFDARKGKYSDRFLSVIVQDIKENWQFEDEWGFQVIVQGRSKDRSSLQECNNTLKEILEGGVPRYLAFFAINEIMPLPVMRNRFIEYIEF